MAKSHWTPVPVKIQAGKKQLSIKTQRGSLLLQPSDGSWKLLDSTGNEIFAASPKAIGFAGERSHVGLTLADGESLFGLGETTGTFDKRGLAHSFRAFQWGNYTVSMDPAVRFGEPLIRSCGYTARALWEAVLNADHTPTRLEGPAGTFTQKPQQ